jgi:uncharacterized DUF497 family protein
LLAIPFCWWSGRRSQRNCRKSRYSIRRYSWDTEKNRRNLARHAIAFVDAQRIFDGPTVEKVDDHFDYGEVRVYAVGLVNGLEITVVYTDENDDERRIISAW